MPVEVRINSRSPYLQGLASMAVSAAVEQELGAVAMDARSRILSPPKTGRWYRKYHPLRVHQASAPGESPANDLGGLVADVDWELLNPREGLVGCGLIGLYLEMGTTRMAPRPFLGPAMDLAELRFPLRLEGLLNAALTGGRL